MTIVDSPPPTTKNVERRAILKWGAAVGGGAALIGTGAYLGVLPGVGPAQAAPLTPAGDDVMTYWNACLANCGSRCPLRLEVKDGIVTRVLPDNTGDNTLGNQTIRACVRGRSQRQRIYSAERIKTPLKRVGKRGEGKWEPISWDEALDTVAAQFRRVIDTYGNEALWYHYGSGSTGGNITKRGTWPRLMNVLGGYLGFYGDYSTGQFTASAQFQYGTFIYSNSLEDAANSQLLVLWGNNPIETRMSGGGELFVTQQTKRNSKVRTIVIDPMYSDTAQGVADEWVAIRPGTDAALAAAFAHVMITNDLVDQKFLDEYCVGFDEEHMPQGIPAGNSYKSYILGLGPDGVEKTPAWAAKITGIPAAKIEQLGREIGRAKPCAIVQGWGPQRHANGENQARAIFTMAALTGSVGIAGGGTGGREGNYNFPLAKFPLLDNPVTTQISHFNWFEAIQDGPSMTAKSHGVRGADRLKTGIKMMVVNSSNALINQHSDVNLTRTILEDDTKCEFIVVIDHQYTSSAAYADILLPGTTNFEEADVIPDGFSGDLGYAIAGQKAIEPLFEARTGYDICTELAQRLGVEQEFTEGRTQEEWVTYLIEQTRQEEPAFPSQEELEATGVFRQRNPEGHFIALKDFREDPVANPLATPSGKIEIFSQQLWEMSQTWELPEGDKITALPEHIVTWESAEEAKTNEQFPLQMIGHHYKGRTHSSYANIPWMLEAHPQIAMINTADAAARGIENSDTIQIFNERGRIQLQARVTPRIAPGVISVPQGAWSNTNKDLVDVGGNINSLTKAHPTPIAKSNPQHTNLVQVAKA